MTTKTTSRVYNVIILDESGSMQSIKSSVINGFNEIIQSIHNEASKDNELEQWLTFFSFNGNGLKEQLPLTRVAEPVLLSDKNYRPDFLTPLYDAIGIVCNKVRATTEKDEQAKVLLTILTDGEENSSTEYNYEAVRSMISELKEKGWYFTYIGTEHDVRHVSLSLNIKSSLSFNKNSKGVSDFIAREKLSRSNFYDKIRSGKLIDPDESYFDQ